LSNRGRRSRLTPETHFLQGIKEEEVVSMTKLRGKVYFELTFLGSIKTSTKLELAQLFQIQVRYFPLLAKYIFNNRFKQNVTIITEMSKFYTYTGGALPKY
jgi:hypothetical protein